MKTKLLVYNSRTVSSRYLQLRIVAFDGVVDCDVERGKIYMYGHTYSKSVDQLGKVANPARGQLNRENKYFTFAPENLVSQDGFGSPVPF